MVGSILNSKIINKTNLLIAISGNTTSLDLVEKELETVEKDLNTAQEDLNNFLSVIKNNQRYFNAAELIRDNNREIEYKDEITTLEMELADVKKTKEEILEEKNLLQNKLSDKEATLEETNTFIDNMKNRVDNSSLYVKRIEEQMNIKKELETEIKMLKEEYALLEDLTLSIDDNVEVLKSEITSLKTTLNKLRKKIGNKSAYANDDLRNKDEERLNDYKNTIDFLTNKREEVKNNMLFNIEKIRNKIKNKKFDDEFVSMVELLADSVKEQDYMDLTIPEINRELVYLENEKRNLETNINAKDYSVLNPEIFKRRIKYLNKRKETLITELIYLKEYVEMADNNVISELFKDYDYSKNYVSDNEKRYEEYKKIRDNESSVNTKKQAELNLLLETLFSTNGEATKISNRYLKEIQEEVKETEFIVSKKIPEIEEKIVAIDDEIHEINFYLNQRNTHQKDIIEISKDEHQINLVEEKVKILKERRNFGTTAPELLEDIKYLINRKKVREQEEIKIVKMRYVGKSETIEVMDIILPGHNEYAGGFKNAA